MLLCKASISPPSPSSQDNLGLEKDCDWGVPLLKKPTEQASATPPLNLDGLRCRRESEVSVGVSVYMCVRACTCVYVTDMTYTVSYCDLIDHSEVSLFHRDLHVHVQDS
jgi:hypothetical protein